MEKRLREIQERAAQILKELENEELTAEQIDALEAEQRSLENEANTIKRKMDISGKLVDMEERKGNTTRGPDDAEQRAAEIQKEGKLTITATEVRGAIGRESRSTLIGTDTLLKPTKSADGIRDNLNPVSSIIDQVSVIDATGAASYEEAYVKAEPEAKVKADNGQAATDSDPVFRVAKLAPSLINVTTFVSRNIQRVSPLSYVAKIRELALKALRRKVTDIIVNGGSDVFGIKTAKNTKGEAICKTLSLASNAITADTLKNIVFAYGGNDELGGNARLFLTKEDLAAFGAVRGTNEKKAIYEITPSTENPNVGTIKEGGVIVPYTIYSGLTALSTATQGAEAIQTMLYGDPANFELALFGDYTIEVYKETKAVEGMLTVIGEVMAGGNVVVDQGFVIVTLAAKSA